MAMTDIKCPFCNQSVRVQTEWNGMTIACPVCNQNFTVNLSQNQNYTAPQQFQQPATINPNGTINEDEENLFTGMRRYADFKGRSSRRELALFMIMWMIFSVVTYLVPFLGPFILNPAWSLATLVPMVAVTLRRLHDVNWHWALVFIPGIQFVLLFVPSNREDNQYGLAPADNNVGASIACVIMAALYPVAMLLAALLSAALMFF